MLRTSLSTLSRATRPALRSLARAHHAPPVPTSPAPHFSAPALHPNGTIGSVSLSDYAGKWLVLISYPLDWTFTCPPELTAFSDRAGEFAALGCGVVGLSVDSAYSHLAWSSTPRNKGGLGGIKIPLIADVDHSVSEAYGLLLPGTGFTCRGTVLIDPKGTVRHISLTDAPVGRSVDEVLRLVQAFQFVEKHGEVCPANWTPGAKTIKPSPTGSQEYFAALK